MPTEPKPLPTLQDLTVEACMLASLIEGLDVLNDMSDTHIQNTQDITSKRAANAMRPTIEAAIKAAWELTSRLELLEDAERKERQTRVAA